MGLSFAYHYVNVNIRLIVIQWQRLAFKEAVQLQMKIPSRVVLRFHCVHKTDFPEETFFKIVSFKQEGNTEDCY